MPGMSQFIVSLFQQNLATHDQHLSSKLKLLPYSIVSLRWSVTTFLIMTQQELMPSLTQTLYNLLPYYNMCRLEQPSSFNLCQLAQHSDTIYTARSFNTDYPVTTLRALKLHPYNCSYDLLTRCYHQSSKPTTRKLMFTHWWPSKCSHSWPHIKTIIANSKRKMSCVTIN